MAYIARSEGPRWRTLAYQSKPQLKYAQQMTSNIDDTEWSTTMPVLCSSDQLVSWRHLCSYLSGICRIRVCTPMAHRSCWKSSHGKMDKCEEYPVMTVRPIAHLLDPTKARSRHNKKSVSAEKGIIGTIPSVAVRKRPVRCWHSPRYGDGVYDSPHSVTVVPSGGERAPSFVLVRRSLRFHQHCPFRTDGITEPCTSTKSQMPSSRTTAGGKR